MVLTLIAGGKSTTPPGRSSRELETGPDPLTPPLPLTGLPDIGRTLTELRPDLSPEQIEELHAPTPAIDAGLGHDLDQLELLLGRFTGAEQLRVAASVYLDADGTIQSRRAHLRAVPS
jgi:hypothetical protein